MKTLMVSHLLQLLWAEAGTLGRRVPGVHGRAPGAPNPALRGRLLQRDNFPPALRPLTISRFSVGRNPRAGMELGLPSLLDLRGKSEGPAESWRGGRKARGMGNAKKQPPGKN